MMKQERRLPIRILKKALPRQAVKPLLPYWHFGRAVAANAIYLFPARKLNVIAVTGTNGKTTTSNYIASILMAAGYKVGLSTTAVFRIGDKDWDNQLNMTVENPFALNKLLKQMKKAKVQWAVIEFTSLGLHQRRVMGIPVHTAVLTNLTQDHLDYHGTMQNYAAAKASLFKRVKHNIILNRDDDWFEYFKARVGSHTLFTYGSAKTADVRVLKANLKPKGSKVLASFGGERYSWDLQLPGKFNVYNAMAAATAAVALAIKPAHIIKGLAGLEKVPGRMETIEAGQAFNVVVDYAHTPDALENVFETLRPITKRKLIAVYGAMGDRDKTKRPLMGQIGSEHCDVVIVTDEEWYTEKPGGIRRDVLKGAQHKGAKAEVHEVADRKQAIQAAFKMAKLGDTVAILGLGHQKYRVVDGEKIEWDERQIARDLLDKLHLSKGD